MRKINTWDGPHFKMEFCSVLGLGAISLVFWRLCVFPVFLNGSGPLESPRGLAKVQAVGPYPREIDSLYF